MRVFPGYLQEIKKTRKDLEKERRILYQDSLDFKSETTTTISPMLNEKNVVGDFLSSFPGGNLIIIDNGSTDSSVARVLRTLNEKKNIRLVLIQESKKGVGYARETGCRYLCSKLLEENENLLSHHILSTDTDCIIPKKWKERYENEIFRNKYKNGLLFGSAKFLPEFERYAKRAVNIRKLADELFHISPQKSLFGNVSGNNFAVSAGSFLEAGGIPQPCDKSGKTTYGEDTAFKIKLQLLKIPIRYIENYIFIDPRRYFFGSVFRIIRNIFYEVYSTNGKGFYPIRTRRGYSKKDDLHPIFFFLFERNIINSIIDIYIRSIFTSIIASPELIDDSSIEILFHKKKTELQSEITGSRYHTKFHQAYIEGDLQKVNNIVSDMAVNFRTDLVRKYRFILRRNIYKYFEGKNISLSIIDYENELLSIIAMIRQYRNYYTRLLDRAIKTDERMYRTARNYAVSDFIRKLNVDIQYWKTLFKNKKK